MGEGPSAIHQEVAALRRLARNLTDGRELPDPKLELNFVDSTAQANRGRFTTITLTPKSAEESAASLSELGDRIAGSSSCELVRQRQVYSSEKHPLRVFVPRQTWWRRSRRSLLLRCACGRRCSSSPGQIAAHWPPHTWGTNELAP